MKMKIRLILVLTAVVMMLLVVGACQNNQSAPVVPVDPGDPGDPGEPPAAEILVGKLFFHDHPQLQYDIFMADLYLVLKEGTAARSTESRGVPANRLVAEGGKILRRGIIEFDNVEFDGSVKERVVLNSQKSNENIDISLYDIELRNLENLTNSPADDFALSVNSKNWLTFVSNAAGADIDWDANEIVYMDLNDRVLHQLTPIQGKYGRRNVDPNWKDDNTIAWVHATRIMEVNIDDLVVNESVIPEMDVNQYDPVYSSDGTMLLFNAWHQRRKKNNFIKYMETNQIVPILPVDYFNAYKDDNPTWIFSDDRITAHIFMPNGRIYTRNIATGEFLIITDGERDFRYVTPVQIAQYIYLVFVDWTDESQLSLWICHEDGTYLRPLDQNGDEPVFQVLGLPAPQSEKDMDRISRWYTMRF
jgi:hypothetical protein